jgi:hypothetical protein
MWLLSLRTLRKVCLRVQKTKEEIVTITTSRTNISLPQLRLQRAVELRALQTNMTMEMIICFAREQRTAATMGLQQDAIHISGQQNLQIERGQYWKANERERERVQ